MNVSRLMKRFSLLIAVLSLFLWVDRVYATPLAQRCVIANEDCFTLRVCAGGLTPEQRIERVNERLAVILGCDPTAWRCVPCGHGLAIFIASHLLVTCTPEDARAAGVRSVEELASRWIARTVNALWKARPRPGRVDSFRIERISP